MDIDHQKRGNYVGRKIFFTDDEIEFLKHFLHEFGEYYAEDENFVESISDKLYDR